MTPSERLIALLEEAPRLSLFVRNEVRFDKFDAYELVTAIRNDGPPPRLAEAGPGDFIFVPPYVPHQEINASPESPLSCVVVRSGQEPVVVNLDLPNVEPNPEAVRWVDDIHPG